MRGLSVDFIHSLKQGLLHPILDRVKRDDTLMLSIRDGYINIYYRGGNLLKVSEQSSAFDFHFDKKYDLSPGNLNFNSLNLPEKITSPLQVDKWVSSFASIKELMDFWLAKHRKSEREFQQLVERENNRSSVSGETEYFITDIELTDSKIGARFDMTAIKWTANSRKDGGKCKPAFIEMKNGDGAFKSSAGLIKHIKDINEFLKDKKRYSLLLETMTGQFDLLDKLGLLEFKHSKNQTRVLLNPLDKPEFIFLLANRNPRSSKLKSVLTDPEFKKYMDPSLFDLRFYVCSDAGYGMHSNNMLTYDEYLKRL